MFDVRVHAVKTRDDKDETTLTRFAEAYAAHRAGRLAEAETGYRAVLRLSPTHADAWHLLGVVAQQQGRAADAVMHIKKALSLREPDAATLTNLGISLAALGRNDEAAAAFEQALTRDPNASATLFALGNTLRALGRLADAERRYRQAIAQAPAQAAFHNNLGAALKDLGRLAEAEAATREAIRLDPAHARAQYNLGVLLQENKRREEAAAAFRRAIALAPDFAEAHTNLGGVLQDLGDIENAIAHCRRAIALNPKDAAAFNNLGANLRVAGDHDGAMRAYQQALELNPDLLAAKHNEGVALEAAGRTDEALSRYQEARGAGLDFAEAELRTALLQLARGNYAEGWKGYDARWNCRPAPMRRKFPYAPWQGSGEGGVLVWGEQGVGDEILYASMLPDLIDRVESTMVEVEQRLVPLFARSFPGATVVARTNPPNPATACGDLRWHTAIADLGRWLRPDTASFPGRASYLTADPDRSSALRRTLERLPGTGPVVGLSWISRNVRIGQYKSLALADFAPLFQIPGVRFVDLQYGDTTVERAAVQASLGAAPHHVDNLDLYDDIDGAAALAAACDFVISVSSVTAHLAAAVGRPTWVLVPAGAGKLWYWMQGQDHTPWYPGARIFRQERPGDWAEVIKRLTDAFLVTQGGRKPLQQIN